MNSFTASGGSPLIVGIGGTLRPNSTTERAVRAALVAVERAGGRTAAIAGPDLDLPLFAPHLPERSEKAARLVALLRQADGVILASPGYHGSISGLMKNAIDYIEDMSRDSRVYLDGRAVGCVATAAGWQGTVTTLGAMRDIVHALRGWPTPLGIGINTTEPSFDEAGNCLSPRIQQQVDILAGQVLSFARQRSLVPA